jgi:hypothetical protein
MANNTFLERARARMSKLAAKQQDAKNRVRFRVSPGEKVTFATPTGFVKVGAIPPAGDKPPTPVAPPVVTPPAPPSAPVVTDIDVPGPNGGRKCSACGKVGHTKAKCPDLEMTDEELEKLTAPGVDDPK